MTTKPNYAPKSFYRSEVCAYNDKLITWDAERQEVCLRHNGEPPLVVRARIARLAKDLLAAPGAKTEFETKHTFLPGVYVREMFIPKGELLIGKIHRLECVNVVSKGDISILTETGSGRVKAGYSGVTPAGIQKVGFAHEDTVFINIFPNPTDERDIEKLEQMLVWENHEAMERLTNQPEPLTIEEY